MRVVLLLDFDGVIVDSPAHFVDASEDVARLFFPFLPRKREILDRIYGRYVKRKGTKGEPGVLGRLVGIIFYPVLVAWNRALAKHSEVLPGVEETLKWAKRRGATIILFSSKDWVSDYKERRFRRTGLDKYFDDVVSFRDYRERKKLLENLREQYRDAIFIWVDDRPHRFRHNVNGRIVPVWFQFPTTAEWEKEVAKTIPRLRKAKNWEELREILKEYL
ncbi:MAG: putative hydrolase of the superfamily [Candidatus Diapherotrites archaeon]|nr:putative hydrolase of the superfamily [Candidatus Diapherotrites archaeon]MDN5366983.1 putative hydrolase of the superfamily [Candidatus Diapherotrites archaeon]